MNAARTVSTVFPAATPHWVGDGFPVRSIFSVHSHDAAAISPFLLLDLAGPHDFAPSDPAKPRGVDQHPHRGFETVTILYHGELEHRDSSGASGMLGPGDVQWMTAAAGIVHEEKHSTRFTRNGGMLEMIQLWVNLPANRKGETPRYQDIRSNEIPSVTLPENAGAVRVIAGRYDTTNGPADTFTPINMWELTLNAHAATTFKLPEPDNAVIVVVRGSASIGSTKLKTHQGAHLNNDGQTVTLTAGSDGAKLLILSGQPIDEPVVAHGPFVMNSPEEIRNAVRDYQLGRMGTLSPATSSG